MSGRKIVETRTVNRKHEKHAGRAVCMYEREREREEGERKKGRRERGEREGEGEEGEREEEEKEEGGGYE